MFKLLIVDDEELDREGLRDQIAWSEYNITTVSTAKNGFDALRRFNEIDPDILISDVKMPGMTGMKLVEELKKIKPSIKVIFVSGYDDFDFARTAMKLEAYEYILKPVKSEEIINALIRVVSSLEQEVKDKKSRELLDSLVVERKSLLKETLLRSIMYGTIKKHQLNNVKEEFNDLQNANCFVVVRADVDDYSLLDVQIDEEDRYSKLMKIYEFLKTRRIENLHSEMIRLEPSKFIILYYYSTDKIDGAFVEIIKNGCNQILEEIKGELDKKLTLTLVVGCLVNTLEEVYKSYNYCCDLVSLKLLQGKGTVISEMPVHQTQNLISKKFNNISDEIAKSIRNSDFDRINYLFDYLFYNIENTEIWSSVLLQDIFINIVSRLKLTLYEMNIHEEELFGENVVLWDKLLDLESIEDIKTWLNNIFETIIDYLQSDFGKGNKSILEKVKQYIEMNYFRDISLKEIAQKLYYSPNHLGLIVKEYTGKGFHEYLIEYRMKKATEFLKDSSLKIYEVAERVSYKNTTAFTNKFREIYGVSPKEYRDR